jgi:hypothetical protein
VNARWLLSVTALCCGCASTRGPDFPTSATFPDSPRHSPSFAAEPGLEVGQVARAAGDGESRSSGGGPGETGEAPDIQSVVAPLDSEAARDLVSRFFIAVLLESGSDLYPLFAAQAWAVSEGNRQPAQALWRARLAQLDYTSLSGRLVATPQTLRTYTFRSGARARQDGVLVPATPEEVVVVARPGLSWAGKTRLFGDALAFRLRPKRDLPAYEIAEIAEDFRLP